jgi:hypothetical protein
MTICIDNYLLLKKLIITNEGSSAIINGKKWKQDNLIVKISSG